MGKCDHEFIFLEKKTKEETWHNFVTYDIFYCKKCLEYRQKEIPKPNRF